MGEPDSPANTPRASVGSLVMPSRAVSTCTLVSDVISLVKLRSRNWNGKHSRLRESVIDPDTIEKGGSSIQQQADDGDMINSMSTRAADDVADESNFQSDR